MGAARKLQGEIDRTLKKVQEGIVEFDQIWEKVYDTASHSQREKYEADLKKEIKKLQRLRDQIKTWIAGTDVKDKSALLEARKNIEKEMERFKNCEKEAKTKAFSKAGLGQAVKLDPEEKARQEAREWLNEQVESLQKQIDEFEAELESLSGSKKQKKPGQRQQLLEDYVVRHKSHIARLEQCMRCLDNGTVAHDEIESVKESVEYYLTDYDDEDAGFENVDDAYAPLLERLNDVTLGLQAPALANKVKKAKDLEEEQAEREREKERAAAAAVKAQLLSSHSSSLTEEEKKVATRSVPISANSTQTTVKRRMSTSEVPIGNHSGDDLEGSSPVAKGGLASSLKNEQTNGSVSFAAAVGRNAVSPQRGHQVWDGVQGNAASSSTADWVADVGEDGDFPRLGGHVEKAKSLDLNFEGKSAIKRSSLDTQSVLTSHGKTQPHPEQSGPTKRTGFKPTALGGPSSSNPTDPLLSATNVQDLIKQLGLDFSDVASSPVQPGQFESNPAASLQLLQACSKRSMPQPIDGDYRTQLSHNTSRSIAQQLPASFPIHRLPQLEDPNFYQQIDTEGLFYAFYFLPGDIVQYCAAKELKRQSWRYHIEHKAWFQRSGEPVETTKDYEEGSYIYFDKSMSGGGLTGESEGATNGWCYRKKDDFVFRYEQLEDELQ